MTLPHCDRASNLLDVYIHPGLTAGPSDPYNRHKTTIAGSCGQLPGNCPPPQRQKGTEIHIRLDRNNIQVHMLIFSHQICSHRILRSTRNFTPGELEYRFKMYIAWGYFDGDEFSMGIWS